MGKSTGCSTGVAVGVQVAAGVGVGVSVALGSGSEGPRGLPRGLPARLPPSEGSRGNAGAVGVSDASGLVGVRSTGALKARWVRCGVGGGVGRMTDGSAPSKVWEAPPCSGVGVMR